MEAQSAGTPAISLLVPCYNVERYLRECLDSAKNQTLRDIEVICINDGSTDSTPSIIAEYVEADERFRMIDKPNSGYGCSMNRGLDEARGEYIGILESDDYFELDALEQLYAAAKSYDADVVKADFWLYWSVPEPRNERFNWTDAECAGFTNPQEDRSVFYKKPSIWSAIYKRSFLKENNIRFLETPGASYQDAGFNFKVWASASRAVLLDAAVLHYRQDNESSSVNSPGKVYCVCDEYDGMLEWLAAREEVPADLLGVLTRMRFDSYMWNYERLSEPLQREFIVRAAADFRAEDAEGVYDESLFDWWKVGQRDEIKADALLYHAGHTEKGEPGKLATVKRYWNLGGMPYLAKMVVKKVKG